MNSLHDLGRDKTRTGYRDYRTKEKAAGDKTLQLGDIICLGATAQYTPEKTDTFYLAQQFVSTHHNAMNMGLHVHAPPPAKAHLVRACVGLYRSGGLFNGSPIPTDDSHERNHPPPPLPLPLPLPPLFWVVVKMGYFLWRRTDERGNGRTNVTFINMMANIFLSMSGGGEVHVTASLPPPHALARPAAGRAAVLHSAITYGQASF